MAFVISLLVFVIGLLVQYFYLQAAPLIAHYDSVGYVETALHILRTGNLSEIPAFRTPGYPVLLALMFQYWGLDGYPVIVLQHCLIAALAGFATLLTSSMMRLWCAALVGLLIAVDPVLALYGSWITSEIPFCFAFTLAVTTGVLCLRSLPASIATGVFFGISTLIRPNGIIGFCALVVLLVVGIALKRAPAKHSVKCLLAATASLALVVSPWMLYRYTTSGEFSLASPNQPFLAAQMLQNENLFDPQLIRQEDIRLLYAQVAQGGGTNEEETVNANRSLAWAFRFALIHRVGEQQTDQFYRDYLQDFRKQHAVRYYQFMWDTFLELLNLKNIHPITPYTANRYLGQVVPYEKQLASVTANTPDFRVLYRPAANPGRGRVWQTWLHYIHFTKPLFAALLLLGVLYGLIEIVNCRTLRLLLLLPYLAFVFQAIGYSLLLHYEDRYSYVLNPLLYVQLGLLFSVKRLREAGAWEKSVVQDR